MRLALKSKLYHYPVLAIEKAPIFRGLWRILTSFGYGVVVFSGAEARLGSQARLVGWLAGVGGVRFGELAKSKNSSMSG